MKEENILAIKFPEIAAQWHPTRNGELTPGMVTFGSEKKVWWICDKGHEWEAAIANRVRWPGCPICGGKIVLPGFNDLATTKPELAAEWHPTKNGELTAQMVTAGSSKKVWWQCAQGHEWKMVIWKRLTGGRCPKCSLEFQSSFPEQAISYYLKKVVIVENRFKVQRKEIDIYLPELRIGIEYNGGYFHRNKEKADAEKVLFFADQKIRIITVKESNDNRVGQNLIEYVYSEKKDNLSWVIAALFNMIELPIPVIDPRADATEIYSQYIALEKENSLAARFPELAAQWHPTKNGKLTPEMVTPGSHKRVWWQCTKGHEWQAVIKDKTDGNGCPYCSGHKLLRGFNDLATIRPEVAAQWHPTKNGDLTPQMVTAGSGKRVWWFCNNGHEWENNVNHRTKPNGSGCPVCWRERRKQKIFE